MRILRRFAPLFGLLFIFSFHAFGQYEIVAPTERRIIPVAIESSDEKAAGYARMAFRTHGGFSLARPGEAEQVIQLTPSGNQCTVKVHSGNPAQASYHAKVTGKDWNNALFVACDQAVQHLTGKPGYFGGQIALVSDRGGFPQIWSGDLFFRSMHPVNLRQTRAKAQRPYLSPDGRTLIFRSYASRFPDLYQYDLAAGSYSVFSNLRGTNAGGAISPDGRQAAVTVTAQDTDSMELVLMDINNPRDRRRLTRNRSAETDPCWSPDGRRLLVTSDSVNYKPQIFEISAQGGPLQRIKTNISGYCAEPTWNPRDDSLIAFTASMGGGYQLAIYQFGADAAKPLTGGGMNAKEPVWLPDGRHILFTEESKTGNDSRLAILDTVTGRRTAITPNNFGNASQSTYAY